MQIESAALVALAEMMMELALTQEPFEYIRPVPLPLQWLMGT